MKNPIRIICVLLFISTACASVKNPRLAPLLQKSNCNQQNSYDYSERESPRLIHEISLDTVLVSRFSPNGLNVANAVGLLDMLADYVKAQKNVKQNPTIANRLNLLELKQEIDQRINLSSLEVSAVAAEMDCEEERTSQIANYLQKKEDDLETVLTVGSIIVGAVSAVATAVLVNRGEGDASDYVGVGSGILGAAFGVAILLDKKKVNFQHERNALKVVWEGKQTAKIFPPFLWYYLNYFDPKGPEDNSFRRQILEKWTNFGQVAEVKKNKRSKLIDIYFGSGGQYTSEQLVNRANMYDQLESYITLMKQDLKNLSFEVETLKIN